MQYILSQEEFDLLNQKARIGEATPDRARLLDLCMLVANHVPLDDGPVWGCILSDTGTEYCDECPAAKICPYSDKQWSN